MKIKVLKNGPQSNLSLSDAFVDGSMMKIFNVRQEIYF